MDEGGRARVPPPHRAGHVLRRRLRPRLHQADPLQLRVQVHQGHHRGGWRVPLRPRRRAAGERGVEDPPQSRSAVAAQEVRGGDGGPVFRSLRRANGGARRVHHRLRGWREETAEHGVQVLPGCARHHRDQRVQLRLQGANVRGARDPGYVHGAEGGGDPIHGPAADVATARAVPAGGLPKAEGCAGRRQDHPGGDRQARRGLQAHGGGGGEGGRRGGVGEGLPERLEPVRASVPHRRAGGGFVDATERRPALVARRRTRDHRVGAHVGHVRAPQARERGAAQAPSRRARRGSRGQALPHVRGHDEDALPGAVLPRVHEALPAASRVHQARGGGGRASEGPRRRPGGPGPVGQHIQPAQVAGELGTQLAGFRAHAVRPARPRSAQRAQHRVQVHPVQRGPSTVSRG
mmetsp:Transcript_8022/g.32431  ORF Transcript_8022/g.32431 Transcript_8022/m.32431 type:complete len:406 (-) Transcript_8022:305-1522(-)